jgi:CHAT domain-containing protein/Tfp pilus assembly protein PilF
VVAGEKTCVHFNNEKTHAMRILNLLLFTALLYHPLSFSQPVDTTQAREYLANAVSLQKQFKPKQAIPLLIKAKAIYSKITGTESEIISDVYYYLGDCYLDLGEYDLALKYLEKSLAIRLKTPGPGSVKVAGNFTLLGFYYDYQAAYNKAIGFYEKALEIYKNKLPQNDYRIGVIYNNLGICFFKKGDIRQAYLYFEKTIAITISQFGREHSMTVQNLVNLGICNSKMKRHAMAEENFRQALDIAASTNGLNTSMGAQLYNSIGVNFFRMEQFDKALEYLEKALNIRFRELGSTHPEIATNYFAIGDCHLELKNYNAATHYFHKALKMNIETLGKTHPETGLCYERIARVFLEKRQPALALRNIDLALAAFEYETSVTISARFDYQLLEVLESKARIHKMLFEQRKQPDQLIAANQIYEHTIRFINQYRDSYNEDLSKEALADRFFHIYDDAIETSFLLFEKTNDENFLRQAFQRSENSSGLVLLEALCNSKAQAFAGIPDSLLDKEQYLKTDIAFFENQKREEENLNTENRDAQKLLQINSKVFDLKQQYYALVRLFEAEYPKYYKLKYDLQPVQVSEVQQNILQPDQALVSYFTGKNSIFVFIISKSSFSAKKIEKNFPLEEWIATLRSDITRFQFPFDLPGDYHEEFVALSHKLYQKLIEPIEAGLPERIVILPGGSLAYLPFEALITSINDKAHHYKSHRYLLDDFTISYCYSATLLKEMTDKKPGKAMENFIAVAPVFGSESNPVALRSGHSVFLKHNIPEARKVAKLISGKTLLGEKATRKNFIENAHKYRIIHLATHGKAHSESGEYSHLGFSDDPGEDGGELLYAKDIYNLRLNAEMITLSACETGIGELRRGEGIISLARGFSFAGASSINTTLWSVNDAKTADLMAFFYKYIKSGRTKDEAMRLAKLDFIHHYDHAEVHPFFWSSFIAIGDMKPIDAIHFASSGGLWQFGLLGSALLIVAVFIYFKKGLFRNMPLKFFSRF